MSTLRVFIENEAGSRQQNHYDERTLRFLRAETVSRPYPFPYGFVLDTVNADGDCLDGFVIARQTLKMGDIVECEILGLMEQTEDGLTDDNVLMRLAAASEAETTMTGQVQRVLTDFVQNVFNHLPNKTIVAGRFLDATHARFTIHNCRPVLRVVEEPLSALPRHAQIPVAFTVNQIAEVSSGSDGACQLAIRAIEHPYVKDYDVRESPMEWPNRFDLSHWGLLAAYQGAWRVGGAVLAHDTAGVDLLEGRSDLALLWDIRVRAEVRHKGIGTLLFRAAEEWALARGCTQIMAETQNVNVGACRFYEKCGCTLLTTNPGAYQSPLDEIQLLWYKTLRFG